MTVMIFYLLSRYHFLHFPFKYVDALKSTIHDNLKQLAHAPSVQFVDVNDNFLETFDIDPESEEEQEEE